ncbi:MAG TPA: hypothetical protein VJI32_07845 [Candidatus Nanoarchaeia archaeon]|nr:hypothetical protein [Candidatus Nanoarchaeia archaeon]
MAELEFNRLVGPTQEWVVTAFQEWQKYSGGSDCRVSAGWARQIMGTFIDAFPDDFKGGLNYKQNGGDCYLLLERQADEGILTGQTQGCYLELGEKLRNGRPNPGFFMIRASYSGLSSAIREVEANPLSLNQLLLDVCGWGTRQPEHADLFASMGRLYVDTPEGARKYSFLPSKPLY